MPRSRRSLDKAKFEPLVGSWMHLDMGPGAGWESVQLVEMQDIPSSEDLEQFAIRFRADPQVELEQGIYTVDTGTEAFDLHLQPAEGDENGAEAVASFSLLSDTTPVPEPGWLPMLLVGTASMLLLKRFAANREPALVPQDSGEVS